MSRRSQHFQKIARQTVTVEKLRATLKGNITSRKLALIEKWTKHITRKEG
jgi:hypothetical protein